MHKDSNFQMGRVLVFVRERYKRRVLKARLVLDQKHGGFKTSVGTIMGTVWSDIVVLR